jgi:hypothetical protein
MRDIAKIVVHCSDSPDERDIGLEEINIWHSTRWSGIWSNGRRIYCGYHYIIRRNGIVEMGRPEAFAGAHVHGHNQNSVGICWVGRRELTDQQRASLLMLVGEVMDRYGLNVRDVLGHSELNKAKTCPNINMDVFRRELGTIKTGGMT